MTRRSIPLALALFVGGVAHAAPAEAAPTEGARTDHVLLVSVDGLRPDAIGHFGATYMSSLIAEGAASLDARTIMPSKTLPSHTSMLTGATPDVHGVTWNTEEMETHGHVATPTVFAAAGKAGLSTAAVYSKRKFAHLMPPGTVGYAIGPRGWPGIWTAGHTVDEARDLLGHAKPNLMFVHIAEPDYAGHTRGWMSPAYGRAVRKADRQVRRLLDAADRAFGKGEYTVILTADHGGHDKGHGTSDPRDVTIPWIAWGEGVTRGELTTDIHTMDSAATAMWLLGVDPPADSVGRPVVEAFDGPATADAR